MADPKRLQGGSDLTREALIWVRRRRVGVGGFRGHLGVMDLVLRHLGGLGGRLHASAASVGHSFLQS